MKSISSKLAMMTKNKLLLSNTNKILFNTKFNFSAQQTVRIINKIK